MLLNNAQKEFEPIEVDPRHRFELRFTAHGGDVVSVGMCARDPHQEVVARLTALCSVEAYREDGQGRNS